MDYAGYATYAVQCFAATFLNWETFGFLGVCGVAHACGVEITISGPLVRWLESLTPDL